MKVRMLTVAISFTGLIFLSGCASPTPTTTTTTAYVVYKLTPDSDSHFQEVAQAFISGTKEYINHANVLENPPPSPLPLTPGRFEDNPLSQMKGMQGFAAMAAMSGASLPRFVTCPGAAVTVRGADNDFSHYGKSTSYTFCLYPYADGYEADGVATYTSTSGLASDPAVLGAEVGGVLDHAIGIGSPSTFIEKSFGNLKNKLQSVGTVSVVTSFDPFLKN